MFAKNLRYLRERNNMEQMDLAEELGRKSASSISEWEKGKYTPKMKVLSEIAKIFNVNIDDLMEKDLSNPSSQSQKVFAVSRYRHFDTPISAGLPDHVDAVTDADTIELPDSVMGKHAGQRDIFITRVNGESMNRIIPDGSLIAVKPIDVHQIKQGDIVVYSDNGDYSVKRFYKNDDQLIFRPDSNDDSFFDYITSTNNSNLVIHGKVVVYIVELD